jgi:LacI family transcriptional regulator
MDIILFFQSTLRKSWQQKLAGVHMFAQERGWFVQVISLFNSPEEIRNALKEWHPIGCLVDCAMSHSAPTDKIFRDIPTVYLDQDPAYSSLEHPCLLHDSAAEAKLAGAELLKLKCKSYAYIGTGKNLHWDRDRLAQFQKDVRATGASVAVLPQTGLQEAIVKLPKPCGILGTNDDCAIKAYHAATAAGLAIPDDVAIVGIDNDEIFCEAVSPGLTSAEPDFERAGYRLAQMLSEEIEKREKGRGKREMGRGKREKGRGKRDEGKGKREEGRVEYYGPLRLVRRGSTAVSSGTSPSVRRALEYIRRNACSQSICLDRIIEEMGCSRRMGTLRFRKETGRTILEEIHEHRFEKACDLLSRTSLPIATVVAHCGYRSDAFAKKMFLARTGITMREYRKSTLQQTSRRAQAD